MSVNNKPGVRARVLECLRNSTSPVSGEGMADSIGVSRVAVWKAIRTLNDSGYAISATPAGYLLERDRADGVFPWEFAPDEAGYKYIDETGSTMDAARTEALAGCDDGLIVLADRQTDGRGTGGRTWQSFDGALFFTMVTRPSLHSAYSHRETLRAQLAIADAIEAVSGQCAMPHWPNDVYLPSGKACGILSETLSVGPTVSYLNLGIGVNTASRDAMRHTSRARADDSRSVGASVVRGVSRKAGVAFVESGRQELLKAFRARFSATGAAGVYDFGSGDGLARAWNARCPLVGKTVRYRIGDPSVTGARRATPGDAAPHGDGCVAEGTFAGVDAAGWAIMMERTERHLPPGTITILEKGTRS